MDKCEVGTRLEVIADLLGLIAVRFTELHLNNQSGVNISSVQPLLMCCRLCLDTRI